MCDVYPGFKAPGLSSTACFEPERRRRRRPGVNRGDAAVELVGRSARVRSGLAEDPVEVRAADRADGLRHLGALVVDPDLALGLALLLALHAVELAAPGLRHDGLLAYSSWSSRRGFGEARRGRGTASSPSRHETLHTRRRRRGRRTVRAPGPNFAG